MRNRLPDPPSLPPSAGRALKSGAGTGLSRVGTVPCRTDSRNPRLLQGFKVRQGSPTCDLPDNGTPSPGDAWRTRAPTQESHRRAGMTAPSPPCRPGAPKRHGLDPETGCWDPLVGWRPWPGHRPVTYLGVGGQPSPKTEAVCGAEGRFPQADHPLDVVAGPRRVGGGPRRILVPRPSERTMTPSRISPPVGWPGRPSWSYWRPRPPFRVIALGSGTSGRVLGRWSWSAAQSKA